MSLSFRSDEACTCGACETLSQRNCSFHRHLGKVIVEMCVCVCVCEREERERERQRERERMYVDEKSERGKE